VIFLSAASYAFLLVPLGCFLGAAVVEIVLLSKVQLSRCEFWKLRAEW
jgi:hypothetical protein